MAYEGPNFVQPINMNNLIGGGKAIYGRDDNLHVEFYVDTPINTFKSAQEGRPIFDQKEMVYIHAPGNKSDLRREVRLRSEPNAPSDPERFPRQWEAFRNKREQTPTGTPVENAPFIQPHRSMELKAMRIFTVEQLAMIPDSIMQTIGMDGRKLRDMARAYLDDAVRVASVTAAEAKNEQLMSEIEALKQQVQALSDLRSERKIDDHQS